MFKRFENLIFYLIDFLMMNLAFFFWSRLRWMMGFFTEVAFLDILKISVIVYGFWLLVFIFFGLYKTSFAKSRTDEFVSVIKTVSIGVFIIFLVTFDVEKDISHPLTSSRLIIAMYWGLMVLLVSSGRIFVRTVRRKLLEKGIGRRKALIVGWGNKAKKLFDRVIEAPALGYDVIGFVTHSDTPRKGDYKGVPIKGRLNHLNRIIQKEGIGEVLIALPRRSESHLEEVIGQCDGTAVGLKILPDLYDVIIGQVRTNQIYGFPLIEILPEIMPAWESIVKRMIDIVISSIILLGFFPLWIVVAVGIRIDSEGPIFYTQKRVGKDGRIYTMLKFRSMVVGAEKMTGPIWASSNDPRVTRVGRFLRRLRLDEIPQLINVLDGDMSLVGPRPERPFFVEKLKRALPLYARRLRVRPGITGWAQVKGEYDQSIEHVKQKLAYDLFYLENMSLRMDLKIILNTIYVMLRGRGH